MFSKRGAGKSQFIKDLFEHYNQLRQKCGKTSGGSWEVY